MQRAPKGSRKLPKGSFPFSPPTHTGLTSRADKGWERHPNDIKDIGIDYLWPSFPLSFSLFLSVFGEIKGWAETILMNPAFLFLGVLENWQFDIWTQSDIAYIGQCQCHRYENCTGMVLKSQPKHQWAFYFGTAFWRTSHGRDLGLNRKHKTQRNTPTGENEVEVAGRIRARDLGVRGWRSFR